MMLGQDIAAALPELRAHAESLMVDTVRVDHQTGTTVDPTTLEERVAQTSELTDPAVVADVEQPKTVKVKSPLGAVTEVPEGIVEALLDSGYTKSK